MVTTEKTTRRACKDVVINGKAYLILATPADPDADPETAEWWQASIFVYGSQGAIELFVGGEEDVDDTQEAAVDTFERLLRNYLERESEAE